MSDIHVFTYPTHQSVPVAKLAATFLSAKNPANLNSCHIQLAKYPPANW